MSKVLVGIEKINEVLNEFLAEFDPELKADMGTEFCYWITDNKIEYSLMMPAVAEDHFMRNFNLLAPDIDCDSFLASFLHELGHHQTLEMIEDDQFIECINAKREIAIKGEAEGLSEETIWELHKQYFDLPDEYEATMWAINFIRDNIEKIRVFWKKVSDAIMNFYFENDIELG